MPALDTTSPTMFAIDCGGNATGRSNVRSYDGHRRPLTSLGRWLDVESVEVRLGQRADDLPHAVRAVVEADHASRRRASARPACRRARSTVGVMNSSVSFRSYAARMTSSGSVPSGPTPWTATRYHFSVRSQRLSRSIPKYRPPRLATTARRPSRTRAAGACSRAPERGIVSRPSSSAWIAMRGTLRSAQRSISANRCLSIAWTPPFADEAHRGGPCRRASVAASQARDERRVRERTTGRGSTRRCARGPASPRGRRRGSGGRPRCSPSGPRAARRPGPTRRAACPDDRATSASHVGVVARAMALPSRSAR